MTAGVSAEDRVAVQPNSGPEPTSGTPGHGDAPGSSAGARTAVSDSVRRRLRSMPARGWRSWVAAAWVVAIAAILRFVNLGLPDKLIFDEVLLLGTPALWWSFLPALAGLAWFGVTRRDWRAGAIGAAVAAGILPWFYFELKHRTMYYFYALPAEPFLVMAVVYVLGGLVNGPGVGRLGAGGRVRTGFSLPAQERRLYGTLFAGAYTLIVALCFWWYYPTFVGNSIPYADWLRRMLLGNRWV